MNHLKAFRATLLASAAIAIVSLLVIDNNSPLEITSLRLSWFGDVWNAFITPGTFVLLWPLAAIFELLCRLKDGCAGLLDGGLIDTYFFFVLAILVGLLYGFIGFGVARLVKKLRNRS